MHLVWLISILLFFLPQSAFAERKRLAVLEFASVGVDDNQLLASLSDSLRSGLIQKIDKNEFLVLTPESTVHLLKNIDTDASCMARECDLEIGKNIGADFVFSGHVRFYANTYIVTVELHNTTSSELLSMVQLQHQHPLKLIEQMPSLGEHVMVEGGLQKSRSFAEAISKGKGYEAILIPSGSFSMGCTSKDRDCFDIEHPIHQVTLHKPFYMMTTEVTQGLYRKVMGKNPSGFSTCGLDCPVEKVSWYDAVRMANKLSEQEGLTPCYQIESGEEPVVSWTNKSCNGWRLPTEAEWEFAARGGDSYTYAGSNNLDEVAWFAENSGFATHPVRMKKSNGYGLYDMSGNVWEWVWDWKGSYTLASAESPVGPESGSVRIVRGGSWKYIARYLRTSGRYYYPPLYSYFNLGFRLCRNEL